MLINLGMGVSFLIVLFIISFVYISKNILEQFEHKIFKNLMVITIIGLILDLIIYYFAIFNPSIPELYFNVVIKALYLYYVFWMYNFVRYSFFVLLKKNSRIYKFLNNATKIFYIMSAFLTIFLPIEITLNSIYIYPLGIGTYAQYIISIIGMNVIFFCGICNPKKFLDKKAIPLIACLILGLVSVVVQYFHHEFLFIVPSHAIAIILMYFTMENPDVKILNEMYRNKELVEQTYIDKSNFLFELTGEVRNPLFNISNICSALNSEEDKDEIKRGLKAINSYVKQLDFIVNDVLDVSSLDVQKVKFVDNRYNIQLVYDEVVSKIKSYIKKEVEFRSNIVNHIPYLYGDSIKLKQMIMSILLNSVKRTEKGYIEFNIDTIEKYDVCRLIITIKDTGSGMSIDKINEILENTGELQQSDIINMSKSNLNMKLCQKIVKLLGGNLMIKSELGKGTEVILTMNQKISVQKEKSIVDQYEAYIKMRKKYLIVSQNKEVVKEIKDKLAKSDIDGIYLLYGADAIDNIRSGKSYDCIIIDDEMKEMSGYETLKKLHIIKKIKTPVIIMLHKNKENIKEHYLNDGFTDYILLDNLDKELDKIINKY